MFRRQLQRKVMSSALALATCIGIGVAAAAPAHADDGWDHDARQYLSLSGTDRNGNEVQFEVWVDYRWTEQTSKAPEIYGCGGSAYVVSGDYPVSGGQGQKGGRSNCTIDFTPVYPDGDSFAPEFTVYTYAEEGNMIFASLQ